MSKDVEILIAGESPAESEHLKNILERHGYCVSVEHDSKLALDAVSRRKPQIVISAVMLPDKDGYKLCRSIKDNKQLENISVILLTSLSNSTDIIRGMECGADNFVTKPLDEKLLISTIENILLKREPHESFQTPGGGGGVEVILGGEKYSITQERQQIVDLLISTYETAVQKNIELQEVREELNGLNEQLEERVKGRTGELTKEIIEYRAAEASLKEQQKFLRQMIDANPNIIFVKDEKGRFVQANQAMARIYGIPVESLIGKTAADFILDPEEAKRVVEQDEEVLATLQSKFIPEERVTDLKTGEVHWLQTVKKPLLSSNGRIRQILCVATDITERKRAEEERDRFFSISLDLLCTVKFDGYFKYLNPAWKKTLGFSEEELFARPFIEIIHPEDRAAIRREVEKLIAEGSSQSFEIRLLSKDGTVGWFLWSATPVVSERLLYVVGKDITERKRAEESLKQSEQDYRRLFEQAHDAIIVFNPENEIVLDVNERACQIYGFSRSEFIGLSLETISKDVGSGKEKVRKTLEKGRYVNFETVQYRKDGSEMFLEVNASAVDYQGQKAIISINRDITERKRGDEKLRDSERYFRSLIENTSDLITVLDGNGIIRYESPSLERMLGYRQEERIGKSGFDLIHPDDMQAARELFDRGIQNPGVAQIMELRFRHKDDSWHLLEITGINLLNDPAVSGIIINSRDITERKKAEKALLDSELLLRQAQKMEAIGTLTGGVAHDFNNLLTAILGNTQLALGKLPNGDPLQSRLIEIEKAGNRAAILTSQLLAFSRRQHLERRAINLNDSIAEIIKLLQRIIGEDVEMSVKCAFNLWSVYADPAQIEQVVMNLVVNARDAMPEGGKLLIETCNIEINEDYSRRYPHVLPGKYVQIRVSDSGSGMAEETKAHIFEPYFTTKELGKGTGLGLSMVYGIITQHDGYIDVLSELGHGTTFEVFLPVVEKTVDEQAQAIQLPLLGGMETILVAEDEEPLRNLAKDILEGLNYTVLLAKNGEEAVDIYEENPEQIDMLLFDVVMPRMGGVEASERIRALGGKNIPLMFMTGYSFETIQNRFEKQSRLIENLGAMVIQKPYSVQSLGRSVREVLDAAQKAAKSSASEKKN